MDYVDLTQAAFEALQSSQQSATATQNQEEAHLLRGRILGVLIRRARYSAQHSVEDCAALLRVDAQLIEAWELGESVPSLPQLESLTRCLLAAAAGEKADSAANLASAAEFALLRQRMIGAKLRSARILQDFAVEELSRSSGLAIDLIERYEFGEVMIPVSHLCVLAQAVHRDLSFFLNSEDLRLIETQPDSGGPAEAPTDTDMVRFAADDRNRAFIHLAMVFRQIDRDDLQRIAEALYNIINDKRDANGRSAATP